MRIKNGQAGVSDELRADLARRGFAVVPLAPPLEAIASARDDDGDFIFAGGTEYYFRNDTEACWYGEQVWRGLVRSLMDSEPNECLASSPQGSDHEAIHGCRKAGDKR